MSNKAQRSVLLFYIMMFVFSPLFLELIACLIMWVIEYEIPKRLKTVIEYNAAAFFFMLLLNILFGFNLGINSK